MSDFNKGDYFIMTKMPDESGYHAYSYCKDSGLYIGCVCEYIRCDSSIGLYISKLDTPQSIIYLGVEFFEEYFRKDLRIKNLEKLGI